LKGGIATSGKHRGNGQIMKPLCVAAAFTVLVVAGFGQRQASAALIDLSTLTPTNQVWSDSILATHNAGGSATNFSGTGSASFGAVGSNFFAIEPPSPFPPGGGIMAVSSISYADARSSDFAVLTGSNSSFMFVSEFFQVAQYVVTQRNSADGSPSYSNAADLKSVIEIETPAFGAGHAVLWDLHLQDVTSLPNGGSATESLVDATVLNVTTGETLFSMSGPLSSLVQNQMILTATPGDILRFSFEGSTSSVLPIGTSPFGGSGIYFFSIFTTVAAPVTAVPEPTSGALLGLGLTTLGGVQLRRQRKTRSLTA